MIYHMKRTTLILTEHILKDLKSLASKQGRTLSALVDQCLRDGLLRMSKRPDKGKLELPSFAMGQARVNVADRDQLEEFLND